MVGFLCPASYSRVKLVTRNIKAAEITQYSSEDVMGRNLVQDFITEDYKESVTAVLKKSLKGQETSNFGKCCCIDIPSDSHDHNRVPVNYEGQPPYRCFIERNPTI